MTITFKMKKFWLDRVPAIVHIDETARPQLVKEKKTAFHRLLTNIKTNWLTSNDKYKFQCT